MHAPLKLIAKKIKEKQVTKVTTLVSKNSIWIRKIFLSPLHMDQILNAIYSYVEVACKHSLVVS